MAVQWNAAAMKQVQEAIDRKILIPASNYMAMTIQRLAPVDTGALRASVYASFNKTAHQAIVHIPKYYAVYQEFGTRFMKPHPFIRPAILETAKIWKFDHVTMKLLPAPQKSEPLKATTRGFMLPKHQPLTAKQAAHVRKHLAPTSKRLHKQFTKAGIKFSVSGPP